MKTIHKYLDIYFEFIKTSIAEQMSFRINFLLMIILDIIFFSTALLSISFIYDHIPMLGTWDKNHFLFFTSFILALDSLHMGIIASNFWLFSMDLKMGNLDFTILKPANIIFQVFFRYFRVSSVITTTIIAATLIHFGILIQLTFVDWCLLPILLLLSFILTFNLELIIATFMFWLIEGNGINFFRIQVKELSNWPSFIYGKVFRLTFCFLFPILLIGSAPADFLFENKIMLMLAMIFAILLSSIFASLFFKYGLRRYESASS